MPKTTGTRSKLTTRMWRFLLPWRDPQTEEDAIARSRRLIARAEAARLAYIQATMQMLRR